MKAIEITEPGDIDVLQVTERDMPQTPDDHVLIRVMAAGVNRPDIIQRKGHYPPPPGVTDIPGLEVAGEIVESHSTDWKVGDKVCALIAGGGYAEYAVAPAGQCLPIASSIDITMAAGLPETVFTVWNNVFKRGRLQNGERLLIHGGTSGIGTTAIQMAKHAANAHVIVTAGNHDKCEAAKRIGADHAINYRQNDFAEEIMNATNGEGVDVILDMVGGDYLERNIKCLREDGRHVSIAFLNGVKGTVSIPDVMRKRLTLTGSTLRPRPIAEKTALRDEIREHIWPLIDAGKIKPLIHAVFPLDHAGEAHKMMEDGQHIGKIVLTAC